MWVQPKQVKGLALTDACSVYNGSGAHIIVLMTSSKLLPLEAIPIEEDYCLYSPKRGLLSSHMTALNAIRSFTLTATADPKTDARIYKREADGWRLL